MVASCPLAAAAAAIPPVAADTRIEARLDTQRLDARMNRAGIRDQYGRQQLLHTGQLNHSTASKDTMLMPNYPGDAEQIEAHSHAQPRSDPGGLGAEVAQGREVNRTHRRRGQLR